MKTKDKKELREKNAGDLMKKIKDLEKEKTNKTLELKMGKIKNMHVISKLKKDIAVLKTYLKIKQISADIKEGKNEK